MRGVGFKHWLINAKGNPCWFQTKKDRDDYLKLHRDARMVTNSERERIRRSGGGSSEFNSKKV